MATKSALQPPGISHNFLFPCPTAFCQPISPFCPSTQPQQEWQLQNFAPVEHSSSFSSAKTDLLIGLTIFKGGGSIEVS